MTFEQFARMVASRKNDPAHTTAQTLVSRLRIEKPELERSATREHGDPTIFPEKLTLWIEYVQNNWEGSTP